MRVRKMTRKFKCEWCRRTLSIKNLYSYEGWRNYNGKICKKCKKAFAQNEEVGE